MSDAGWLGVLMTGSAVLGWLGRGWVEVPPGCEQIKLLRAIRATQRVWRRMRKAK